MTAENLSLPADQAIGTPNARYDRVTIAFHWLTALLVLTLFGSSWWWNSLPGGTPLRKALQAFHVSIGLLFVVVFIGRLVWRWSRGRRLPDANTGIWRLASRGVHLLLYVLLALQIGLGFALRWAQGEEFYFFGTFSVPEILGPSKTWEKLFEPLHNYTAWAIVILAGAHAIAALVHHYLLRDDVLGRMLPSRAG